MVSVCVCVMEKKKNLLCEGKAEKEIVVGGRKRGNERGLLWSAIKREECRFLMRSAYGLKDISDHVYKHESKRKPRPTPFDFLSFTPLLLNRRSFAYWRGLLQAHGLFFAKTLTQIAASLLTKQPSFCNNIQLPCSLYCCSLIFIVSDLIVLSAVPSSSPPRGIRYCLRKIKIVLSSACVSLCACV